MVTRTDESGRRGVFLAFVPGLLALTLFVGCSGTPDDGGSAQAPPAGGSNPTPNGVSTGDGATAQDPSAGDSSTGDPAVDRVFDQMELGEQERARTAQFYLKQGQKNFSEADYRSAAENFEKALRYDPSSRSAREGLAQSQMFLGRRDGEIRTIFEQLGEEIQVLEAARLAEVRQLIAEGRDQLAQGEPEQALRALGRARERLIWFEYGVDVTGLQGEAQVLYDQARDAQNRLEAAAENRRQDSASGTATRLAREEEERRRERIAALIGRSQDSMIRREYATALQISERILVLDPDN